MNSEIGNVEALGFPLNDAEANKRFQKYWDLDPLEAVPPALLNAGDIYDYARITGMIWPFVSDDDRLKESLKPASYEIEFLGTVHYVDEKGAYQKVAINRDTPFTLKKNSIVFVSLACKFRLPSYIALRFNLRIIHVHRGLLLGTGPLIDPGFVGRLLIPVHNLTDTDYCFRGGEGFIWVEFTKLSPRRKDARMVEFPATKLDRTPQQYFNSASSGKPTVSSIPGEVAQATENAKEAQIHAEKAEKFSKRLLVIGGVTLFLSVVGIVVGVVSLVVSTWNVVSSATKSMNDFRGEVAATKDDQVDLETRIKLLEAEIQALRSQYGTSQPLPGKPR